MKRRTLLKSAASTGLLALGATTAVSASTEDPEVAIRDEETGEYVSMPLSEADVEASDCCIEEDGCGACACYCCVC